MEGKMPQIRQNFVVWRAVRQTPSLLAQEAAETEREL